jgi:hypothetical protein
MAGRTCGPGFRMVAAGMGRHWEMRSKIEASSRAEIGGRRSWTDSGEGGDRGCLEDSHSAGVLG